MKKSFIALLFLSSMVIAFIGCSKDTTETCNLHTSQLTTEEMKITFTATSSGDGAISTLTYNTPDTIETIPNPILPWTIKANATGSVSIVATGTVTDGGLTVALSGESATGKIVADDFCSHSN